MKIKYVGKKPTRKDTVAGTGIVWLGAGDVQDVPDDKASILLAHPDIWLKAEDKPAKVAKPAKATDEDKPAKADATQE